MSVYRDKNKKFIYEKVNLLHDVVGLKNILELIGCSETWFYSFYRDKLLEYGALGHKFNGGRRYLVLTPYLFMKWRQEENLRRFKEDWYYDERSKRFKRKVQRNTRKRKKYERKNRKIKTRVC